MQIQLFFFSLELSVRVLTVYGVLGLHHLFYKVVAGPLGLDRGAPPLVLPPPGASPLGHRLP
jgi:hypothetical protein